MAQIKKIGFQIPIAIVCLALSFTITWQYQGVSKINKIDSTTMLRIESLQEELYNERDKNIHMHSELLTAQNDIEKFRAEIASNSNYSAILLEQLQRAEMLAGLTDVEGEGIIVTLTDNPNVPEQNSGLSYDPNYGIIHDDMILRIINELCASGAEAISLNNERIIATSEVRCVGSTVIVNKNRYIVPFVIRAIGNSNDMDTALRMKNGAKDYIEFFGGQIDIKKSTGIFIKRFTGAYPIRYALPVATPSPTPSQSPFGG